MMAFNICGIIALEFKKIESISCKHSLHENIGLENTLYLGHNN